LVDGGSIKECPGRRALSFDEEREIAPFLAAKTSHASASAFNRSRSSRIGATILD